MVFSLLLLGGYAAVKGIKGMDNKVQWEKIVADYKLERDFYKVLMLCGKGDWDVNWSGTVPEINDTVINNCVKNLRTIPYLNEIDILEFELKAQEERLKKLQRPKKQKAKEAKEKMQEIKEEIKGLPTQRRTFNKPMMAFLDAGRKARYYKLYTETIWGELVFNPKYEKWIEENSIKEEDQPLYSSAVRNDRNWRNAPTPCGFTDKYEVWVVDAPIPSNLDEIYNICNEYIMNNNKTAEEREISSTIITIKQRIKWKKGDY